MPRASHTNTESWAWTQSMKSSPTYSLMKPCAFERVCEYSSVSIIVQHEQPSLTKPSCYILLASSTAQDTVSSWSITFKSAIHILLERHCSHHWYNHH